MAVGVGREGRQGQVALALVRRQGQAQVALGGETPYAEADDADLAALAGVGALQLERQPGGGGLGAWIRRLQV